MGFTVNLNIILLNFVTIADRLNIVGEMTLSTLLKWHRPYAILDLFYTCFGPPTKGGW